MDSKYLLVGIVVSILNYVEHSLLDMKKSMAVLNVGDLFQLGKILCMKIGYLHGSQEGNFVYLTGPFVGLISSIPKELEVMLTPN